MRRHVGVLVVIVSMMAQIHEAGAGSFGAYAARTDIVRGIPRKYWYINPTITATSQWMVEVFVSSQGSDKIDSPEKGFQPGTAFRTVMGCLNYLQTFFLRGVWPTCRVMGSSTPYQRRIELTGGPFGRQMDGGGPILISGTCKIPGSPWNNQVGYSAGISDVKLLSEPGLGLVSTINSGYLMFRCLQAGADGWVFSATQNGLNQLAGGVEIVAGPSGIPAAALMSLQGGQNLVGSMIVSTSFSTAFAQAVGGGQLNFSGGPGSVVFKNSPSMPNVIDMSYNSTGQMGGAAIFSGAIGGAGNGCSISYNSTLNTNETSASIPHGIGYDCDLIHGVSEGGKIH